MTDPQRVQAALNLACICLSRQAFPSTRTTAKRLAALLRQGAVRQDGISEPVWLSVSRAIIKSGAPR